MALEAKPGEVVTDGKNVTIGAPVVRAAAIGLNQPPDPVSIHEGSDPTAQGEQKQE